MTTATKRKPLTTDDLENVGSLVTIKGTDGCLGYLLLGMKQGVFDAEYGIVPVSPKDADTHNKLLTEALIKGLDESCEVGQGGTFYLSAAKTPIQIKAWTGEVIADFSKGEIWFEAKRKTRVYFRRGDKVFVGTKPRGDDEIFNFTRVS